MVLEKRGYMTWFTSSLQKFHYKPQATDVPSKPVSEFYFQIESRLSTFASINLQSIRLQSSYHIKYTLAYPTFPTLFITYVYKVGYSLNWMKLLLCTANTCINILLCWLICLTIINWSFIESSITCWQMMITEWNGKSYTKNSHCLKTLSRNSSVGLIFFL